MSENDRETNETNESGPSLTTLSRQTLFATAIASGKSIREAARAASVADATAYRWSGDARVSELCNQFRRRIVRQTCGKLAAMGTKATQRLSELMDSDDDAVALKAAVAVLSEVKRIADASGDDVYRHAVPIVQAAGPLDDFASVPADLFDVDPDDEPLPQPPDTSKMKAAEAINAEQAWFEGCSEVRARNRRRRDDKRRSEEYDRQVEAEAEAAGQAE